MTRSFKSFIPKRRWLLALFVALAVIVSDLPFTRHGIVAPILGVSEAQAQQAKKKRRSLLSILFGKRKVKKREVKRPSSRANRKARPSKRKTTKRSTRKTRNRTAKRSTSSAARSAAAAAAAPEAVEKQENARKILIVGDFYAGSLAGGLEEAFADDGTLVVVDKSNGNSGFVRTDIVNWPEALAGIVDEVKPDYIVAMAGSNDRQLMREDGKRLKKRTTEWDEAYKKRVESFADALAATGKPYTWVGLPPVRFNSMNTDFLLFNEWYRNAATRVRGRFVDVWDGFADADGAYTRSGPDVNGQIVLLRPKDGINLTKAGRRRLAFYVEGDIRRELGGAVPTALLDDLSGAATLESRAPEYDPAKTGKTRVISLDDPAVDGAGELAGAEIDRSSSLATDGAVQVSVSPARTTGVPSERADNFAWPPRRGTVSATGAVAARQ